MLRGRPIEERTTNTGSRVGHISIDKLRTWKRAGRVRRTPYTPSPGQDSNWRSDIDDTDETGYKRGDVERSDAVAQDAEALEERSTRFRW